MNKKTLPFQDKNVLINITVISLILIASLWYTVATYRIDWLQFIILIFTFYLIVNISAGLFFKKPVPKRNPDFMPFVSIMIPARNEENVIANTIRSLAKIDYHLEDNTPNFEVLVIDDCSQDGTHEIIKGLQEEHNFLQILRRTKEQAGKGKSAVLNQGLNYCKGEIIGVFDADTRVEPDFLQKIVPYMEAEDVGGVQCKVSIYNASQNILTSLQHDEFAIYNHITQIAKDIINGVTGLGGNGQLTKRVVIEDLGGWNESSPTEDFDLTLRCLLKGWKIQYCGETSVWQEGVDSWKALLKQRTRWAEGFLKGLFDYIGFLIVKPLPLVKKIDALFTVIRILLPLWILQGNFYVLLKAFDLMPDFTSLPMMIMQVTSVILFIIMVAVVLKFSSYGFFQASWRVLIFLIFTVIWLIATPIAFYKYLKNLHSLDCCWDKTYHKGNYLRYEKTFI